MALRRPNELTRRGRRLPGQSSDEDLGLERVITVKVYGDAAVIEQELVQIGNIGKGDYVEIGPNGIIIYTNGVATQVHVDETITVGDVDSGNYIKMDADGIDIYNNGAISHTYDDTTAVINQTTVQVGDVDSGNYIEIGAAGITIYNQGATIAIWSDVDGGKAQTEFRIQGIDASDPDAYIGLSATNYNSTVQNAFTLDTEHDRATIDAEVLLIGSALRLSQITTTQRDNLTAVNGMIVYNSTTSKFQGYAGGSWVDLH